jgi:hypothetical protein
MLVLTHGLAQTMSLIDTIAKPTPSQALGISTNHMFAKLLHSEATKNQEWPSTTNALGQATKLPVTVLVAPFDRYRVVHNHHHHVRTTPLPTRVAFLLSNHNSATGEDQSLTTGLLNSTSGSNNINTGMMLMAGIFVPVLTRGK